MQPLRSIVLEFNRQLKEAAAASQKPDQDETRDTGISSGCVATNSDSVPMPVQPIDASILLSEAHAQCSGKQENKQWQLWGCHFWGAFGLLRYTDMCQIVWNSETRTGSIEAKIAKLQE